METGAGKTAPGLQRGGQHRRPPVSIAELERAIVRRALRDGRIKAARRAAAACFVIEQIAKHEGVSREQLGDTSGWNKEVLTARRLIYLVLRRMEPLGYSDSDIVGLINLRSCSNVGRGSKMAQRRLQQEPDTLAWVRRLYLQAAAVAGVSAENYPLIRNTPKPRKKKGGRPRLQDLLRQLEVVENLRADFYRLHDYRCLTPGELRQLTELLIERAELRIAVHQRQSSNQG